MPMGTRTTTGIVSIFTKLNLNWIKESSYTKFYNKTTTVEVYKPKEGSATPGKLILVDKLLNYLF